MSKFLGSILISFAIFMINGCGFKPMSSIEEHKYISVAISPATVTGANNVLGWEFDKMLLQELSNGKPVMNPIYSLSTNLAFSTGSALVQRDTTVSRYNVKLALSYNVKDIKSGKSVTSGHINVSDGFDIATSPFSNYVSSESAKRWLMESVILHLKHRLYMLEEK